MGTTTAPQEWEQMTGEEGSWYREVSWLESSMTEGSEGQILQQFTEQLRKMRVSGQKATASIRNSPGLLLPPLHPFPLPSPPPFPQPCSLQFTPGGPPSPVLLRKGLNIMQYTNSHHTHPCSHDAEITIKLPRAFVLHLIQSPRNLHLQSGDH